jgi:hypothetical protein
VGPRVVMFLDVYVVPRGRPDEGIVRRARLRVMAEFRNIVCARMLHFDVDQELETGAGDTEDIHAVVVAFRNPLSAEGPGSLKNVHEDVVRTNKAPPGRVQDSGDRNRKTMNECCENSRVVIVRMGAVEILSKEEEVLMPRDPVVVEEAAV